MNGQIAKRYVLFFAIISLVFSIGITSDIQLSYFIHQAHAYGGGGGGGGGGGSGTTLDPRVCGDKLCSDIPGGSEAWKESMKVSDKEESNASSIDQKRPFVNSPLKQIKSGVALVDVICNEGKIPAYKYNAMRVACVSLETESELITRGWALLRLHMYDDDPSRALCERYDGNWLDKHRECEYISPLQCSLMDGEFSECESACRHDPSAELCTLQCVLVCAVKGNHFPEFTLSYSREGGLAGITQKISIDTQNHLIVISGFDSKTLGPISKEDMQRLWEVISENQFFELGPITYPPAEGSADYFTYSVDVVTSPQRNTISWTDTSSEFPKELVIISQEIDRLIQFYS